MPAPVLPWQTQRVAPVSDETTMRLLDLYRHTDPAFARVLEERVGIAAIARAGGIDDRPPPGGNKAPQQGAAQVRAYFADAAGAAARFLARPDGPRVGALAFEHTVNEGPLTGRLTDLLAALDGALAAAAANMGDAWKVSR